MTTSASSQVRVGVRIRPITYNEQSKGAKAIVSTSINNSSNDIATGATAPVTATVDILERKFTFDSVFDEHMTQSQLYDSVVGDGTNNMLEAFLDGYNATILAYGQTGSGKTFTMGSEAEYHNENSSNNSNTNNSSNGRHSKNAANGARTEELEQTIGSHQGLIPRFMNDIFKYLHMRKTREEGNMITSERNGGCSGGSNGGNNGIYQNNTRMDKDSESEEKRELPLQESNQMQSQLVDYKVSASFLEVYGEDIHDLLSQDSRHVLPLREDAKGEVVVGGLEEKHITSAQDALTLLNDGTLNRTTAATLMNKKSSRSHAVFTIYLNQTTREFSATNDSSGATTTNNGSSTMDITTVSKFTFVDLAGSERMKKTGAEGERAREGIKINQGLLALGNVINALADDTRLARGEKPIYVPYRQSRLTRLLQDALGGNSQTLFLACVSPADTNASETASTLKYANRARNIKNAPTKNVDATIVELQRLYALNQTLERELVRVRFSDVGANGASIAGAGSITSAGGNSTEEDSKTCITDDNDCIGEASEELYRRDDVQKYLDRVRTKASEMNMNSVDLSPISSVGRNGTLSTPMSSSTIASNGQLLVSSTMLRASASRQEHLSTTGSISSSSFLGKSHLIPPNSNGKPPSGNKPGMNTERRQSIIEGIDDTILGVNPDEDIALLDKLLELQHIEQEYDTEVKQDREKLEQVEGELEAQEDLLLQLKDNLKGYQTLKIRFENMMVEVQSLEREKTNLAHELESVQVDPSKGCSKAIKRRLDDVVTKLARARSETRKNQQMYRKAEQEAQKARMLQQKIESLKQGRVALMKKQREATAKHRESTEAKTREIQSLKRNERKTGQKMTKLEAEVQKHKANLQKRKVFCDKLSEKLKQTESHLVKVLSIRKRDMHSRKKANRNAATKIGANLSGKSNEKFAPDTEEVASLKFLLEKLVMDRVSISVLQTRYETKASEYSDLMRDIVDEMKLLKKAKEELKSLHDDADSSELEEQITESSLAVEDLEFQLEVVERELDRIRSKLPHVDDPESDSSDERSIKFENDAMKMVGNLSSSVTKTLLWNMLDFATKSEAAKTELNDNLRRKEAAFSSFEDEIQILNRRIVHLTQDLDRRRSMGSNSADAMCSDPTLEEISNLKEQVSKIQHVNSKLSSDNKKYKFEVDEKELALSIISEKMTVLQVTMKNSGIGAKKCVEETLDKLQKIWKDIGLSMDAREESRLCIEACLENSCSAALERACHQKIECESEELYLQEDVKNMYQALGLNSELSTAQTMWSLSNTRFGTIAILKKQQSNILPTYSSAKERRLKIVSTVESIMQELGLAKADLTQNLDTVIDQTLSTFPTKKPVLPTPTRTPPIHSKMTSKEIRATQFKQVEDLVRALEGGTSDDLSKNELNERGPDSEKNVDEVNSLSDEFLNECETAVKKLRLKKAEVKISNQSLKENAKQLTTDMHLRGRELLSLSMHSMKKRMNDLPSWWDPQVAEEVCRSIVSKDGIIRVNSLFSRHLQSINESLDSVSFARRILSETLQSIIKNAHNTLLETVEGEINVNEAYASFDAALQRLPPLSKENINACIAEMNTLVTAVDAMAQSEVEALTVVWEALNVTNSGKGVFWGEVEEAVDIFQSQSLNDFDAVVKACSINIEEWLLCFVKDAQKIHRSLSIGLLKLNKIHEEVERLSAKQTSKSKIMSLDSELCILSAKLTEFEEKANSKQRLTKKANSSSLLKEERFRKQMQSDFTSRLKALRKLLIEWESLEGQKFKSQMLSAEVGSLLANPEQRTAFMHLKTVRQKSRRRRDLCQSPDRNNANKRQTVKSRPGTSHSKVWAPPSRRQRPNSADTSALSIRSCNVGNQMNRNRLNNISINKSPPSSDLTRPFSSQKRLNTNNIEQKLERARPSPRRRAFRSQSPHKKNIGLHMLPDSRGPLHSGASKTNVPNSTPRVQTGISSKEGKRFSTVETDCPVLPFGQVLSITPTEKENFSF